MGSTHPLQAVLNHPTDASLLLRQLVEKGLLDRHGRARGTVYTLMGADILTPDDVFSEPLKTSSVGLLPNSEPLPSSSVGLSLNSVGLLPSSVGLEESTGKWIDGLDAPIIYDLNLLAPELQYALKARSQQARHQKKIPRIRFEEIILKLCEEKYLTLRVLAELLQRDEHYLRHTYLNPLVKSAKLERAFPTSPNDPRQAYRTLKSKEPNP